MGVAVSLVVIALGGILLVHHRIPTDVQPAVIAAGAVLVVLGLAGLAFSVRHWSTFGGPISPIGEGDGHE